MRARGSGGAAGSWGRRGIALCGVLAASLVLVACAPGTLDADPAATDAPDPATPSATASASPEPSPEPSPAGERFDGVDLAAALVPVPHAPGEPERWGPWSAQSRDEIVPALDPAAFEAAPQCAAAVAAADAIVPEEVVRGGYPYEGELGTWIVVGRMASADDASAYVDALVAAAAACEGVQGVAQVPDGLTAVLGPFEASAAVAAAGMHELAVGYDGSFHPVQYVLVAHDELVVATPWRSGVVGGDAESVGIVQTQRDALDAAVGG
ncbi:MULTISPECIES: hypothetical protein [unclassified Agrococcus]|uniref:hypothetical protein n=1 Tax=unclassified Agrococcus TaxID=2615065 RepID=UPI00360B5DAA